MRTMTPQDWLLFATLVYVSVVILIVGAAIIFRAKSPS